MNAELQKQIAWAKAFAAIAEKEILYYSFDNDTAYNWPWCAPWMSNANFDLDKITPAAYFATVKDKMKAAHIECDINLVRAQKSTRRKINRVKAHDIFRIVYKHAYA